MPVDCAHCMSCAFFSCAQLAWFVEKTSRNAKHIVGGYDMPKVCEETFVGVSKTEISMKISPSKVFCYMVCTMQCSRDGYSWKVCGGYIVYVALVINMQTRYKAGFLNADKNMYTLHTHPFGAWVKYM